MSQDTGLFSVKRQREVRRKCLQLHKQSHADRAVTDTRRRLSQCLRDSYASLCHEAIEFDLELRTRTAHHESCALDIRIAHVARARTTSTANVPSVILRRQFGGNGFLYSAEAGHTELLREHGREEELCAGDQYTCESAAV